MDQSPFFTIARGWLNHPVLRPKGEFSRAEAWAWMIEEAAWKTARAEIAGAIVTLQRGQLSHSVRFMARAWRWSIGKVQRFVSLLNRERMIDIATDTGTTVITICNYDKYQLPPKRGDTPAESSSIHQRVSGDTDSNKETRKQEEGGASHPTHARATPPGDFAEWWEEYPHKVSKSAAAEAYRRALSRAGPAELLAGLRRYVAQKPPDRQWCNPATWLSQDRWLDQPAMLLPINGGRNDRYRSSPAEKLFAGFYAAASDWDRDRSGDRLPTEPLLDIRRSG